LLPDQTSEEVDRELGLNQLPALVFFRQAGAHFEPDLCLPTIVADPTKIIAHVTTNIHPQGPCMDKGALGHVH
jgi:hypothetical protein